MPPTSSSLHAILLSAMSSPPPAGEVAIWIVVGAGALCLALGRLVLRVRRAPPAGDLVSSDRETLRRLDLESRRLRASLEGTGEGLLVLDERRRLVAWNQAADALVVDRSLLMVGCPAGELLPWPALRLALGELNRDGAGVQREFDVETGSHSERRALQVRVRSLAGLGFVVGIVDRSRLRQLESMRRDFVANVSHELKTPLAAIRGFVESMHDDTEMPSEIRQGFLDRTLRQVDRLGSLVGDLLTLSRLDEQDDPFEGSCDLDQLLHETVQDLQSMADRRDVTLTRTGSAGPVIVVGEREALRQVFGNLIDNAIKYTPAGGTVTIDLARTEGGVRCSVTDTGIGLSSEDQQRIFERFYRVDRARSRELGGTGLGLAIVKNILRRVGGGLGVESAPGQGSTFWVTLPLEAAPEHR